MKPTRRMKAIDAAVAVVGVLTLLACSGAAFRKSEFVPLRPAEPLAADAPVEIFPATTPAYAWEDVASGEAQCNVRADCFELLRADARKAGADTVYGIREHRRGLGENPNLVITATFARRTGGADGGTRQLLPQE